MKRPYFEMELYLVENGLRSQCCISISEPELSHEGGAACVVKLAHALSDEKRIFGVDEEQAQQLAIDFVRIILAGKYWRICAGGG